MDVFCGIDWAEDHHDIALVDRDGKLLARCRISDGAAGLAELLALLAEHGDSPDDPVPVAIETPRGLLVACLRAAGGRSTPSTRWRWPGPVSCLYEIMPPGSPRSCATFSSENTSRFCQTLPSRQP